MDQQLQVRARQIMARGNTTFGHAIARAKNERNRQDAAALALSREAQPATSAR